MDQTEVMPISCPDCSAQMPETAVFCPGCGRAMQVEVRAHGKVGALPVVIASALAYITCIPAVVFLLLEPYKKNFFVRFHSIQCLLLWVAVAAIAAALRLASLIVFLIPVVGPLLVVVVSVVFVLAAGVTWLVLVVKALQGEMFRLPLLGQYAEQYAGTP